MTAAIIVSHTHWDREWYRPFEAFRSRLVDTVDRVLDQLREDPEWSFLLDGQTVVLEDYLAIRPHRRSELERACRSGRIAIGPWYVQPDSLLPSGETHVRNLLEGRRVGEAIGPLSTVGYTPDSFGHPAQFPQILAGFGLTSFVYWRGNGNEIDDLPPVWRWVAPDGSAVLAVFLGEGYFAAAYLGDDPALAAGRLEKLVEKLSHPDVPEVLLMNGLDHAPPDAHTGQVAEALAARTGWAVRRGVLDHHLAVLLKHPVPRPEYAGELVGGRVANLLPGVWSTRTYLKRHNRRTENELLGWTEPFAALANALGGLPDERPALRAAWRELLVNQAHDSICGCSTDQVHDQMVSRYQSAIGLATETTNRLLERISGLGPDRAVAWREGMDIAVWNPSPHPRTDVVRFPLDAHPVYMIGSPDEEIHPLVLASLTQQGITVDGEAARIVRSHDDARPRLVPEQWPWDVEFVAHDVPAFGWRRYRLAPGAERRSEVDGGRSIENGRFALAVGDDGTLTLRIGAKEWAGLLAIDDAGDRGDSYDCDPIGGAVVTADAEVVRRRHCTGVQELTVTRRFDLPTALEPTRDRRTAQTTQVMVTYTARLAPDVDRADIDLSVDNTARDHRMRVLFPVGERTIDAATTFDVVTRTRPAVDDRGWMQPAPSTFLCQGWVAAGDLTIGAPDLREAELLDGGTLAFTLVRSVGWISQMDLRTRPIPAGPGMPAPGGQCIGRFTTTLHLAETGADPRDAELGLRAVAAGAAPLVGDGTALVRIEPAALVLSACKPGADDGEIVLRVLNPTDAPIQGRVTFALPVGSARRLRLDETPVEDAVEVDGESVAFGVGAHALATVGVRWSRAPGRRGGDAASPADRTRRRPA